MVNAETSVDRNSPLKQRLDVAGFSLIEVMIAVAVIVILTLVALPAYTGYVQEARRADGMDALLNVQSLQERWRANNPGYGSLVEIGAPAVSVDGNYNIAVSSTSAIGYTATATATGSQASDSEGGSSCSPLTITVSATNPRGLRAPAVCW